METRLLTCPVCRHTPRIFRSGAAIVLQPRCKHGARASDQNAMRLATAWNDWARITAAERMQASTPLVAEVIKPGRVTR